MSFKGLTIKQCFLDDGGVKNARVCNTEIIKFLVCNKPLSLATDTGGEEHAFEYEAYSILPPPPQRESYLNFFFERVGTSYVFVNSANFSYLNI